MMTNWPTGTLFYLFHPPLIRFANGFVRSPEMAEEIVSDVFIRIWEGRSRLTEIENLTVYLYVSTRNTALKYLHRHQKQASIGLDDLQVELESRQPDPEQLLLTAELMARVRQAINELPPRCKMVYKLTREDGLRYCIIYPNKFKGYSADCWGLTASDTYNGYNAHAPDNDNGTISPTAALSSFPYSPEESMQALRHFYYKLGNKLWTKHGFVDAFNETQNWVAGSHLAIDQGPIIVMIENHRSGLLWKLFMSCPEVKIGLNRLGFESPWLQEHR